MDHLSECVLNSVENTLNRSIHRVAGSTKDNAVASLDDEVDHQWVVMDVEIAHNEAKDLARMMLIEPVGNSINDVCCKIQRGLFHPPPRPRSTSAHRNPRFGSPEMAKRIRVDPSLVHGP